MSEDQPVGYILHIPIKTLPVIFEGKDVGRFVLYNDKEDGAIYADQYFSAEFNELLINHNNELRFSEISENVDVVNVWRVKEA